MKKKQRLRMFHENEFIGGALDEGIGKLIQINPELETVIDVSKSQAKKEGKVAASYFKYEEMDINDYHPNVLAIMDSIIGWEHAAGSVVIENE